MSEPASDQNIIRKFFNIGISRFFEFLRVNLMAIGFIVMMTITLLYSRGVWLEFSEEGGVSFNLGYYEESTLNEMLVRDTLMDSKTKVNYFLEASEQEFRQEIAESQFEMDKHLRQYGFILGMLVLLWGILLILNRYYNYREEAVKTEQRKEVTNRVHTRTGLWICLLGCLIMALSLFYPNQDYHLEAPLYLKSGDQINKR